MHRVVVGLEKWLLEKPGESEQTMSNIGRLPSAIHAYWTNQDHGFMHTQKVVSRISAFLEFCPNMLRSAQLLNFLPAEIWANLCWSSTFHDLGYFFDYSFTEHQEWGAKLAKYCFEGEIPDLQLACLINTIAEHDYFSQIVNRKPLPDIFLDNPLAEIFRLADKTTGTPAQEIERYYLTGKRYNRPFFNPDIKLDRRLDLNGQMLDIDIISIFMYLFALSPQDFFYAETSRLYSQWEIGGDIHNQGKKFAFLEIKKLARQKEGLSIAEWKQIEKIYDCFFAHYSLPHPLRK